MTKTPNQIIIFFSTKIRIFFSATLGIRIFFGKNSARKREQVGPYVKTTRTVLFFYNIVQYLYVYYIIIYLFKRQLLSFSEKELLIQ